MTAVQELSEKAEPAAPRGSVLSRVQQNARLWAALARTALLIAVVAVWALLSHLEVLDPTFVGDPWNVLVAMEDLLQDSEVQEGIRTTLVTMWWAFLIGCAAGMAVGVVLGLNSVLHDAYMSPLLFILSTPKSMYLPIFLILFGIGQASSVAFGAFSTFFLVAITTVGGVHLVQSTQLRTAHAYGANYLQKLRYVVGPAAIPGIFAALWHGVKQAVSGVLTAELFVSIGGLGTIIRRYTDSFQPDQVLALIFLVSLAAIIAGSAWNQLERRLTKWRQSQESMTVSAV